MLRQLVSREPGRSTAACSARRSSATRCRSSRCAGTSGSASPRCSRPTSASASPATTTRIRTCSSSTARRRSPRSSTPRSTPSSRPRATCTSPPRSRAGTRRRTRGSTGTSGWTSSTTRSSSTPRRTPCIEIVPLDFTTGANVLVSNKGLAACLYFKTFAGTWRPGAGAEWGHGPTLYLFGCDVKDYKVVIKHALSGDTVIGDIVPEGLGSAARSSGRRSDADGRPRQLGRARQVRRQVGPAKAAQAGPDPVDIPAGLPGTVMAFKGADAPPHVILHGPSGQVFDTRQRATRPAEAPGFVALKNDATRHHRDRHREARRRPLDGRDRRRTPRGWSRASRPTARARSRRPARSRAPRTTARSTTPSRTSRPAAASSSSRPATAAAGASASSRADGRGTLKFHPAGRRARQAQAPGRRVRARTGSSPRRLELGTYTAPAPERPAKAKKFTRQAVRQATGAALERQGLQPAGRHPQLRRAEPHPHRQALHDVDQAARGGHQAHRHRHRLDQVGPRRTGRSLHDARYERRSNEREGRNIPPAP